MKRIPVLAVVVWVYVGWAVFALAQTTIQTDGDVEARGFIGDGSQLTNLNLGLQLRLVGPALLPVTGQTTCFDAVGAETTCGTGIGLGQDGDLRRGVAWPSPRFTLNGDGTVTDNLTGLLWLENAFCANAAVDWETALAFANTLFDGSTAHAGSDCGLSDESEVGAWRLPSVRELQSLVHYGAISPAPGDPFSGVQDEYWSSTTHVRSPMAAWLVHMNSGYLAPAAKGWGIPVWPVRTGP